MTGRSAVLGILMATSLSLTLAAYAQETGPQSAPAEDVVVITASGFEQKLTDAPASITVVTAEELKQRPYMTLIDAVRDLEGVDVGETADKTGQRTISLRGMGSDYTLILIDGKRQNNHGDIYPNSFSGNQFNHIPPLDTIERIEVIRGPASTLYGSDALGGVINIITKKSASKWSGSITAGYSLQENDQYGDDSTVDVFVSGPIIKDVLDISLRGSWYKRDASNPVYPSVTDPAGVEHNRALGFGGGGKTVDNTNTALGGSLSLNLAPNQRLVFDYDTSKQEYDNAIRINDEGVEEYPVGTVDNYGAMLRLANSGRMEPRAGYAASQEFTRDTWSLTHEGDWNFGKSFVSLAHVSTNNDGRTLPFSVDERQSLQLLWNAACVNLGGAVTGAGNCVPPGGGAASARVAAWNNQSEAAKLAIMQANLTPAQYEAMLSYLPRDKRTLESEQYTLDAKLSMPMQFAGDHMVVVGSQVIQGKLNDGVFGLEAGTPGGTQDHNMYSVFAEDTWTPFEPFSITGGLRYDDHEVFGDHISPRLYGVYTISSQWTVKGGVSTGFKTPKTTQLYDGVVGFGGQGVSPMFGNPDLKPETSVSTEIAVYWQAATAGHNFNLTVFNNKFEDKITSQPCGGGLTLVCSTTGEYAELGYTTSTRTVNIDEVVISGAEVAGKYEILDNLSIRANYTYTDSEQKSGASAGLPLGNSAKHMANATLNWDVTDVFSTQLMVESRSKRYRGVDALTGQQLYFKDYEVLNLGAQYRFNDFLTLSGQVNNVLDEDFTTYDTAFVDNGDGSWTPSFQDHYNNKDKARSFWVSVNARF